MDRPRIASGILNGRGSAQIYPASIWSSRSGPLWISARNWPSYRAGLGKGQSDYQVSVAPGDLVPFSSFRLANLGRELSDGRPMTCATSFSNSHVVLPVPPTP